MRRMILALALTLSLTGTGCVKAPPNLTPQAQIAFTADQILQRVGELQQAVIDAAIAWANSIPKRHLAFPESLALADAVLALKQEQSHGRL